MSSPLSQEKVSELLTISNEMSQRLTANEQSAEQLKKAVDESVPGVVQELIKYSCIDAIQSDETKNVLSDHLKTLELVKKLAAKQVLQEQLGSPVKPEGQDNGINKSASHRRVGEDFLDSPAAKQLQEKSRSWLQS